MGGAAEAVRWESTPGEESGQAAHGCPPSSQQSFLTGLASSLHYGAAIVAVVKNGLFLLFLLCAPPTQPHGVAADSARAMAGDSLGAATQAL